MKIIRFAFSGFSVTMQAAVLSDLRSPERLLRLPQPWLSADKLAGA